MDSIREFYGETTIDEKDSEELNLGEKIKKFIVEKDYFTACALCGGRTGFEKEIPAAEQAERVLEFK